MQLTTRFIGAVPSEFTLSPPLRRVHALAGVVDAFTPVLAGKGWMEFLARPVHTVLPLFAFGCAIGRVHEVTTVSGARGPFHAGRTRFSVTEMFHRCCVDHVLGCHLGLFPCVFGKPHETDVFWRPVFLAVKP